MEYNKKLDELFLEWGTVSKKLGLNGFCADGLMYRGIENKPSYNKEGKLCRSRRSGDEDKLWKDSAKKIVFLMKDTNGNPDNDYREWYGRGDNPIITHRFFKNIALWLTGLSFFDENGKYLPFAEVNIGEKYTSSFDNLPFAFVNCKKESGTSSISNSELLSYVATYGDYLKKEIEILNPQIIVCGGGSGTVLKIAKEIIYPELEFEQINWGYYNAKNNIVLINSYHPSARVSNEKMYVRVMDGFNEIIKREGNLFMG